MICPHCGKAIPSPTKRIDERTRVEVMKLHRHGFSARDIQHMLGISFSSAARIVREAKDKTT